MIPALFLSIWAFEQNRWKYFIFGAILAACTKDVGAGVVAVDFLIVLPWLAPHSSPVWQATYGWLGATIGTAITNLLKHPHLILWAWERRIVVASFLWEVLGRSMAYRLSQYLPLTG